MGSHQSKTRGGDKFDYKHVGLTKEQYHSLKKEWDKMVVNGRVDRENWIRVAVSTGAFDEEMAGLNFDAFDVDGNGLINIEEYFTVSALSMNGTVEERMRASFNVFDRNHDGKLTRDELRMRLRALGRCGHCERLSAEQSRELDQKVECMLDRAFDQIDKDHSGTIDVDEYIAAFSNTDILRQFMTALNE